MATRDLLIKILGDPSSAVRAFKDVGDAGERSSSTLEKVGKIAAGAFAVAGAAAAGFAASSVKAFSDAASAVDDLQDVSGESAAAMSRLRYAFQSWGVSDEAMTKSLKTLVKQVGAGSSVFATYGIAVKDASGKTLPMSQVVANAADVFKRMPDGIDKTNLALTLFGKNGQEMLDVMNGGKAGFAELGKEADKYGITLTDSAVAGQQKNAKATRQMHAALEGLKIQIGEHLMPIITKVTTWLAAHMPAAMETVKNVLHRLHPAFELIVDVGKRVFEVVRKLVSWLGEHKEILIGIAAVVAGVLVSAFISWAISAGAAAAATIAAAAPVVALGAVLAALVAGIVWVWENWDEVWSKIQAVTSAVADAVMTAVGWVKDKIIEVIEVAIWPIKEEFHLLWEAAKWAWDQISNVWGKVVGFFETIWQGIKTGFAKVEDFITAPFKAAFNAVAKLWNSTVGGFGFEVPSWVPGIGGDKWQIPKMTVLHMGGIVPGLPGQDVPIMAQAGERVISRRQADQSADTGPRLQLVNQFHGITDVAELTRQQAREFGWALRVA